MYVQGVIGAGRCGRERPARRQDARCRA